MWKDPLTVIQNSHKAAVEWWKWELHDVSPMVYTGIILWFDQTSKKEEVFSLED